MIIDTHQPLQEGVSEESEKGCKSGRPLQRMDTAVVPVHQFLQVSLAASCTAHPRSAHRVGQSKTIMGRRRYLNFVFVAWFAYCSPQARLN